MKVEGLDNREYTWKFSDRTVYDNDRIKRSSLHLRCRNILKGLYPLDRVYEEVSLPGSGKLSLDFYLHSRDLAIECHGEQHYKFSSMFHKTRADFLLQRKRDSVKKEWCDINNIQFVELPYNEDTDEWRNKFC